jgi:O-antigen biosynthesis protein
VAEPRFSILTPVYDTPPAVLSAMLDSVRRQTFEDWELCLVDDASPGDHVLLILEAAEREDARIRVTRRDSNGGIVAASNDALTMARGEFAALLDHDDELHPEALAAIDEAVLANPEADYLYTDEDKIDESGRHTGPFFKPDWSPDRLRTQMYTCHLSVLRRTLVEEVGGFDPEFEGSQDWDLILKASERARAIVHVPRILYHWRMLETSAAGGGESAKPWAFEAGRRAVQAHCERIGLQARVERDVEHPGVYHLEPALEVRPPVSIVIPTNGQAREVRYREEVLVSHCVRSIVETSTYENYEILVVADTSIPPAVLDELREIGGDRLRLVDYDEPFNFSAKINLGAAHSEGEHLLLLNDDIEVATPAWIERMVMYSMLDEVGAVGGRLLWEDGRLQHVGVGFEGGLPGHPYRGFSGGFKGYVNDVLLVRNMLAVTGACLMTRRRLFDEVGGLSADLPVNYNDVDYCLKLRARGRRTLYDPDLVMRHFESSSRSSDVQEWEKAYLLEHWLPVTSPDPYSNPNLRDGFPTVGSHVLVRASGHPRLARGLARWRDASFRLNAG